MKTFWEVRSVYYKFNDGRGNNGYKRLVEEYISLECAINVANEMKAKIANSNWFNEFYHIDGYLTEVAVYEITEKKVG